MSVTEQDRERIWQIVLRHSNNSQTSAEYDAYLEDLAQALADERERARAPFLALAEEFAGRARSMTNGSYIEDRAASQASAFIHAADRIRRAAEETQ